MLREQSIVYYPEELSLLGHILDQVLESLPVAMQTPYNRTEIAKSPPSLCSYWWTRPDQTHTGGHNRFESLYCRVTQGYSIQRAFRRHSISKPWRPQAWQLNLGSKSDSLTWSGQRPASISPRTCSRRSKREGREPPWSVLRRWWFSEHAACFDCSRNQSPRVHAGGFFLAVDCQTDLGCLPRLKQGARTWR